MKFNFSSSFITFMKNLRTTPYPEVSLIVSILLITGSVVLLTLWTTVPAYDYYLRAENLQGRMDSTSTVRFDFDFPSLGVLRKEKFEYNEGVEIVQENTNGCTNYKSFVGNEILCNKIDSACEKWHLSPDKLNMQYLVRIKRGEKFFRARLKTENPLKIDRAGFRKYTEPNDSLATGIVMAGFEDALMNDWYAQLKKQKNWFDYDDLYEHESLQSPYHKENTYFNRVVLFLFSHEQTGRPKVDAVHSSSALYRTIFSPYDLSQAYYLISYESESMPKFDLKFRFNTAINLTGDNSGFTTYNTGVSSFSASGNTKNFRRASFHIQFKELENIQFVRMFAITTIITFLLTWMLKSLVGTIKKWRALRKNR